MLLTSENFLPVEKRQKGIIIEGRTVLSETFYLVRTDEIETISKGKKYWAFRVHINQIRHSGCPQELNGYTDSKEREYIPYGITQTLSNLDFIRSGLSVCILAPSDCGKSYFAKALGIDACRCFKVCYHAS